MAQIPISIMKKYLHMAFTVFSIVAIAGISTSFVLVIYLNSKLPNVEILEDIQLQVPLKVFSSDGKLMAEFGQKRRIPIPIDQIPQNLINAILATEDRRFYEHSGVDVRGLLRASVFLVSQGHKGQGGSTITMQVARNFFLTRQKTFARKINEILLALKIEKELDKRRILELYLNKIYFGKNAYGVGAAAQVYYGVEPSALTLDQMAMIAGLPQAPSAVNPINNPQGALKRRQHVLSRMLFYGFITEEQFNDASKKPLNAQFHAKPIELHAPYVAEMVRKQLISKYGESIYTQGIEVYTTIDPKAQKFANQALINGIKGYDQRHGFRGPIGHIADLDYSNLKSYGTPYDLMAVMIVDMDDNLLKMVDNQGNIRTLKVKDLWFKPKKENLKIGDVLYADTKGIAQLPEINGAFVALRPEDGAILSLVGGGDFYLSSFNRAVQAKRQSGSCFKPFIYACALESGYTPASLINDSPVVFNDPSLEGLWRPQNHTKEFGGPTRLRASLTRSRNLVTIRLLQQMGINRTITGLKKLGFPEDRLNRGLSLALGTTEMSPLEMAQGFAQFANGGYAITPYLIEKIMDNNGNVVYHATPEKVCNQCTEENPNPNAAKRVMDPKVAYIMNSILTDVMQVGTGSRAKVLRRTDLAGKTGSTNDHMDAWFAGYNQDVVAAVWLGFDNLKTLKEYGSQVALPVWIDFMQGYLKGRPMKIYPQPEGIKTVRIDPVSGLLAQPDQTDAILEIFPEALAPTELAPKNNRGSSRVQNEDTATDEELF